MEITALWNKSIMTYGHLFYTDVYCQWTCKMILQTMDSTIMILSFELMMLFIHSSCSRSKGGEPCWGHKMNRSGCEMLTERRNTSCLPHCVDVLATHLFSLLFLWHSSVHLLTSQRHTACDRCSWADIGLYVCIRISQAVFRIFFFFRFHQIQCQGQTNNAQIHLSILYDFATLTGALSFEPVGSNWKWDYFIFF